MKVINRQFDVLWNEFSRELKNYIISHVKQTQDSEDILQEVYIKIFKNIDKLENQSSIKSWIYTITKNTVIDFYKKRKDIIVAPETLNYLVDDVEDEGNMNNEIGNCLKKMLFDLPEKYQKVYDLYENKNLKHKDIMTELDISLSTSKVRLMRAKELFKKKLIECCDFETDRYGNIVDYHTKGTSCNKC